MRRLRPCFVTILCASAFGCASAPHSIATSGVSAPSAAGTLARIYYWRAKAGKLEEYSRYVRDIAEPIDREAQRTGAFLSVSTFVSRDPASPWTHMRMFVLRDSAQLAALGDALSAAGVRLEPDSVRRRVRGEYSATLRDRVSDATVELLR